MESTTERITTLIREQYARLRRSCRNAFRRNARVKRYMSCAKVLTVAERRAIIAGARTEVGKHRGAKTR